MQDIAFDMAARRASADPRARMLPSTCAAHDDGVGADFAADVAAFAHHQAGAAHIAIHPAIDLDVARRLQDAGDHHIAADDGGRRPLSARRLRVCGEHESLSACHCIQGMQRTDCS